MTPGLPIPVTCADVRRHELLLTCGHRDGTVVAYCLADGCSGYFCPACEHRVRARHWPDVVERIAGTVDGLDMLALLRAAQRAQDHLAALRGDEDE